MTDPAGFFSGLALGCLIAVAISASIKVVYSNRIKKLKSTLNHKDALAEGEATPSRYGASDVSGILNPMAEGVVVVNANREVLLMNPSAKEIFGVKLAEASEAGKALIEVVRNAKIGEILERLFQTKAKQDDEVEISYPEKRVLKVHVAYAGDQSSRFSAILVFYDVTEIRRLENLRREFVANVSHELKTPLTSIKGFIETLLGGAMSDAAKCESFLKMMEEDAGRLSRLIGDLLELSEIESKEMPLKLDWVDVGEEAEKALPSFQSQIEKKRISAANQIAKGQFPKVRADRDRLKQVLVNLIDNAVKFNREGGALTVRAEKLERQLKVSVEDTGIGIPEHDLPRVFERFYRVDKARSREAGGTGLGLAIVKHIVEAHGGKVSCDSRVNAGSIFSFTLPSA